MMRPASNPFSTRFTRPGCIVSLDISGSPVDVGMLRDRLGSLGGVAAIVGPHGSGKSTLLTQLADEIHRRGGHAPRIRLRSWRDATVVWGAMRRASPGTTVCVDSWECLGLPARVLLRLLAGVSGCGLLVTSHHAAGLPVLRRCATSSALLHAIVGRLPDQDRWLGTLIESDDIREAFMTHRGNLRESLCDLYDRFEARARGEPAVGGGDGPAGGAGRAARGHEIHESKDGFSYAGAPERNLG
jgi:energy-coupling factor transporter ATP-binding protein EcfA2